MPYERGNHWFDSNWKQRDDINAASGEAAAAASHAYSLQAQVDGLVTMVMSLVEILAKDGKLDEPTWRAMVEERLRPRPIESTAEPVKAYTCTKCQREVAPANTTMTANGVVCDACAR